MTPSVCELAIKNIQPAFFTKKEVGGTLAQTFLFEAIKSHHEKYGVIPDAGALVVEFEKFVSKHISQVDSQATSMRLEVAKFLRFIKHVDSHSVGLAKEMVQYLVQTCSLAPQVEALMKQQHSLDTIDSVSQQLSVIAQASKGILGGNSTSGVLTMEMEEAGERVATGIPFIDSRLGKGCGPVTGCAAAIIAPQGGGKSTLGVQLAISQALMQKHTILALAEEGVTIPFRRNLRACTTGIATPVFEQAKDNIREAVILAGMNYDVVMTKIETVDKYLHIVDLTVNDSTSLSTVDQEMKDLEQKDCKPVYTYVDWAGMLADRMLSMGMDGVMPEKKYDALQRIGYKCAAMAANHNAIVAVAQQMAPEIQKKGPMSINDHYCAADCRGFTAPMKYVFVINAPDSAGKSKSATGNSLFRIAKARNDPSNISVAIRLRGELARFEDVDNQFEMTKNKFKLKGANRPESSVPKE